MDGRKSTLGRRVSALAAERGWRSSVLHYDDLIPEYAFRVAASEDNNTQAQTDWKLCRQSLLQCIENFLRDPRVPSDPPDPGRVNDDAWRRCIRDALLGEEEEATEEVQPSPMLLLLDDNFYYPSMRYEVYQLARKCSLGFCQVFLDCSVQSCTRRNQERANPLPTDVILAMSKRLEPPNPQKNPWERNSITLNNSEHLSEMEMRLTV
ncbi:hypothetical protein CRUP_002867 [Coryphaenoides rupestris]|nr:hypothetical protein CRUP_002867 [Coryphaenoides rupestris]